jgi:alpha-galactosidase
VPDTPVPRFDAISWGHDALPLRIDVGPDRVARLSRLGPWASTEPATAPMVEVMLTGMGSNWSGGRYTDSVLGARLGYVSHASSVDGPWRTLSVELADPDSGLTARVHYQTAEGLPVLRSWVSLTNTGGERLAVEAVTSFVVSGLDGPGDLDVLWADNDWLAECRWQRRPLRDFLVDVNRSAHEHDPRGRFAIASQGTWSTGRYLAMGALSETDDGETLLWQVESSAGWVWEVGERARTAYLALLGPTDREHHWRRVLEPGRSFTTVPAAVALGAGWDDAVAAMTRYRRLLRRPHHDHRRLPVIYNGYMNTLMGDPTTEKLLPLVDAAAEVGAECFVVDAGWYDDGDGWWDSVGAWRPSATRFPGGLNVVLDRVRAKGMAPGLWLEPEVVGVRSPIVAELPSDAFFQRDGIRVVEHGRYHLDLRHPAAVKHLDQVIDRLVTEHGISYFKLDYNINPGPGTDVNAAAAGDGLLDYTRAHLDWLVSVLDRHPGLTVENCASGGMRMDYALLAHLQLQSTSDQQDPLRYPPIAASAPVAVTPEQAAVWAYPQPEMSPDEITFTLCTALLGRMQLSGHLDRMTPSQRASVGRAVAVYKEIRTEIAESVPFWPLGLPRWTDPWIAAGLHGPAADHLLVWRLADSTEPTRVLPLPRPADARLRYPTDGTASLASTPDRTSLRVTLPTAPTACLITLLSRA